jgi:hypothetical protein
VLVEREQSADQSATIAQNHAHAPIDELQQLAASATPL